MKETCVSKSEIDSMKMQKPVPLVLLLGVQQSGSCQESLFKVEWICCTAHPPQWKKHNDWGAFRDLKGNITHYVTLMYSVGDLKVARFEWALEQDKDLQLGLIRAWLTQQCEKCLSRLIHPPNSPLCSVPQVAKLHGLNNKLFCPQYGAIGSFY